MKKKMNECLECGYEGNDAYWLIQIEHGPLYVEETSLVKQDLMDPEFFDLNTIDAKKLAIKYNVDEKIVETAILDGRPLCPKCKCKSYVATLEN